MMIAHLPAGYLCARGLRVSGASLPLAWGVIVGSIAPDLDMLWFVLVDGGAVHHHSYLTHRPALWFMVLVGALMVRSKAFIGVGLGALLHVSLDTIAGSIVWGWPIWPEPVTLVHVPPTHDHWVQSFLAHWTFRVELAILATAAFVLFLSLRKGRWL